MMFSCQWVHWTILESYSRHKLQTHEPCDSPSKESTVVEYLFHFGPTWNTTFNLFSLIIQIGPGHTI